MTNPVLAWLDGKLWELIGTELDDGTVIPNWSITVDGFDIDVPSGFVFDLASIPRIMWVVPGFAPFELSTAAPLLHDFIYRHHGVLVRNGLIVSRATADRYFRLIMAEEGVGRIRRTLAWLAVRLGGWFSWRQI